MPGGRSRSDSVRGIISPSRASTMPFISIPSTYSSRIASPLGETASASWRWASISSIDSTRNTPRCPPESAGLSTAGNPTSSAARRRSEIDLTAAKRGCGTPTSASRRRIAILCVIRCAVSTPMPGSPRASAIAATTGTARSALTVRTPSILRRPVAFRTASMSEKSTTLAMSASARPGASRSRSTAATRRPSALAWRIARRWWRPAPTKRTVFTREGWYFGALHRRYSCRVALEGKRIFITGGAGFIGTTLARELVDRNSVVAFDNLHRDALSGLELADHPNFELIQGDVLDAEALAEAAAGATHFVHCAAIAGVDTVLASPVRTMRVNVIGTYHALEAALATLPSLERFVDFSTSEVFGTHAFRVEEGQVSTIGSVGEARWTYAVSKLAGEHMAHAYHDELGLPTVTVHPFNVYGPGQIGGGAIRAFIEAALAERDLTIHGDGSQIRAWTYVTDMVAGVLLCLEHANAVGQAFNIGNPRSAVTIFDLAQRIKRLSGAPGEIVFQPLHYADVELRIPNVGKARAELGWEPVVELDDGLQKTIAWYREQTLASA